MTQSLLYDVTPPFAEDDRRPLVSVIMPAYNATDHIDAALQSVLEQSYRNLEVIVVDDGSTDGTAALVERIAATDGRVRLLRQKNRGVAAARNHAAARARGAFIAPIDADDLWAPQKIERQVDCLMRNPRAGLAYAWWVAIDEEAMVTGKADQWQLEGDVFEALLCVNFVGNASVPLIRRHVFEEVGGYVSYRDEGAQGCEDWDLTLRVAERYPFCVVPAYLVGYRSVPGSMSYDADSMARSYHRVVGAIRERHPEHPEALYTWSRSRFYAYLASMSYNGGDLGTAARWMWRAMRADPPSFSCISYVKLLIKSLLRQAARPVTSRIWPDQASWRAFRQRTSFRPPPREVALSEYVTLNGEEPSWDWKAYKPYDRIRMRRWQQLVESTTSAHG